MQWLTYLDRQRRVTWAASQERGVRRRFGLTRADTDRAAWAFDANGQRYAGAGAVIAALAVALGRPALLRFYQLLPVRILAERIYSWVAEHRSSLPGVEPYCHRPGRDCSSPTNSLSA